MEVRVVMKITTLDQYVPFDFLRLSLGIFGIQLGKFGGSVDFELLTKPFL